MEVKIIDPSNKYDIEFILNNPILKNDLLEIINHNNPNPLTIDQIFEKHKTNVFSIMIFNSHIASIAIGWNDLYITDVLSLIQNIGGCKKVIGNLLDYWWDKNKLQFKNDLTVKLGVYTNNIYAIKCYSHFGFEIKSTNKNNRHFMELTKQSYAEKYLLPNAEKVLQKRLNKLN